MDAKQILGKIGLVRGPFTRLRFTRLATMPARWSPCMILRKNSTGTCCASASALTDMKPSPLASAAKARRA